jgi:hypothetical protein
MLKQTSNFVLGAQKSSTYFAAGEQPGGAGRTGKKGHAYGFLAQLRPHWPPV